MFGDFEAQRHWLEITVNLPISEWYFYDLQYWGLDYPPLTAFHSFFLGKIGNLIDKSWFLLDSSRGFETSDLKSFMRITALISELVIYIPAVVWYCKWMGRYYNNALPVDQTIIAAAILFQPHLIIIDHGHFQYNSVMLGFTLLIDPDVISMVCWICNISLFSMWPLLKRDGLVLQYFVLGILSNWLMGNLSWIRKFASKLGMPISARDKAQTVLPHNWFWIIIIIGSYVSALLLHIVEFVKPPPENLPDLWVIGNVLISFGCFILFWLWNNYKLFKLCHTKTKLV
ncbi:unnamed protein product [[Candida] boidinii]|uniref:Unnamed protein product n=1 Tax=Candida boidinii TaxID=5477 RepID=A0ACB5TT78_CANBO|nr:unnamed protein product [[Candida] boidinii]GMF21362.1 unnamed protein product [[Candida] boidinii]